jgi:ferredoxin
VPGKPEDQWPWYYIDPATCIDCGACVPECPYEAIYPEGELPTALTTKAGQEVVPHGKARYTSPGGEVFDLTEDTPYNGNFYTEGPGYNARNM